MSKPIKLNFLKTGMLTLVVDGSRIGYQKYGVQAGGPMDDESAKLANWLVGNQPVGPVLEINMIGPEIKFIGSCQIAITGADISATIDGEPVNINETISVENASILKFGKLVDGCRAYLAIRGEWNFNGWMDVDSPVSLSTISSLNSIEIIASNNFVQKRISPKRKINSDVKSIRVLRGPEFEWLGEEVKEKLFETTFYLLPASNRMGYRLTPNLPQVGASLISSGVVPGTLQITQDGNPILLMKDAPATGGYVRALNVISDDMPPLGQLQSGNALRFILMG